MKRLIFALLVLFVASGAIAMPCGIDPQDFQSEALAVLKKDYPDKTFSRGKSADVILMGEVEFGLQNLRSKLCLATPPLSPIDRQSEIHHHFEAMMKLLETREPKLPHDWAEAQKVLRPQLMPEDYLRQHDNARLIITKPIIPGVALGVALKQNDGYGYVRKEDLERWGVQIDVLFNTAFENLDRLSPSARLQGGNGPDKFLAMEEKDGFDAVRLFIPWVRSEAAKFLGDPFYAAIPNRDFLVMWSTANSSKFQDFAKQQADQGFKTQPYPLAPTIVKVWSDGRLEVAQ